MTLPTDSTLLVGAGGGAPFYDVQKSLRFRSSASAYLSRTFGTPTNNKIWTYSLWVKRGTLSTEQDLLNANSVNAQFYFDPTTNTLRLYDATSGAIYYTSQVFRDVSSWYHIVISMDTTQATAGDRTKFYVNGVQVTSFSTSTAATLNNSSAFNVASTIHVIGRYNPLTTNYFDGYLAEVNFIDGQALTPSSFGAYNPYTGVWQPSRYTGTYGTNGFYLPFTNTTSTTTLVADSSGNGNNWTPNNISLTSGVTYDSMLDSPTPYYDGGNGRGNYAVFNPLLWSQGNLTFSNANLQLTSISNSGYNNCASTFSPENSQGYLEITWTATPNGAIGLAAQNKNPTNADYSIAGTIYFGQDGNVYNAYTTTLVSASTSAFSNGDVMMMAWNFSGSSRNVWFGRNGVWGKDASGNTGVPSSNLYPTVTNSTLSTYAPYRFYFALNNGAAFAVNFGQRPFTYTPPTGFKALNTQNLPTPTIANGAQYMAATIYSGNGAAGSGTTQQINLSFQPDFFWIKNRTSASSNHILVNANALVTSLSSNNTAAELANGNQASNASGVIVGENGGSANIGYNPNLTGNNYVLWSWDGGGTPTTDNVAGAGNVPTAGSVKINGANSTSALAGSIAATRISANTSAGFSVVTYTGTGANATVGHGLGAAPSMVIVKNRSAGGAGYWLTWHTGMTSAAYYLALNLTIAQTADATVWNSTAPTSSVFSIGTNTTSNNSGTTFVAYCFAPVAGYSAFGSYTGNGSADGTFVYTGFRPRWIMIKRTDTTGDWMMYDTSRDATIANGGNYKLYADLAAAENGGDTTTTNTLDYLSNGFKLRSTNTYTNGSGVPYIYAAFAENPFKYSLAR